MPVWLTPSILKIACGAFLIVALVTGIGLFVGHYKNLEALAEQVPGLKSANTALVKQSARDDSRAAKAAIDLIIAQAQRDQAVADQAKFHALSGQIATTLQGLAQNASATKNPLCLPSDSERLLFNTAVAHYLDPNARPGSSGALGQVPGGAK